MLFVSINMANTLGMVEAGLWVWPIDEADLPKSVPDDVDALESVRVHQNNPVITSIRNYEKGLVDSVLSFDTDNLAWKF